MERIGITTNILSKSLVGILAAVAFTACGESYPSLEYDKDENNHITNTESSNRTPIQVYVNEPSLFSVTASRGMGAVDKEDEDWDARRDNMLLKVFAFHNAEDADFRENMYVSHNGEESPDFKNCLIDNATNSGTEYYEGKPARLVDDEGLEFLKKKDSEERELLYYSSKYQDEGYNFFAYYVDDIELSASNTVRSKDEIYHNIEIDGTQDIMCGYAPKMSLYSVMKALRFIGNPPEDEDSETYAKRIYKMLSPSQQADINNVLNYGYSTYAAHRGVNPVIDIRHQLARLKFTAYPGDETAENITIQGIEVRIHTKGKLTVATNDLSKVGLSFDETEPLNSVYLKEASVDGIEPMQPLRQDYYIVKLTEEDKKKPNTDWTERVESSLKIGGHLLVEPGDVISLTLHYDEKRKISENSDEEKLMKDLKVNYNITAPKVPQNFDKATGTYRFREGYSYDINIAVFGLQPIEIYAQMEGWKDGDDVDLGEEEFFDPENNNN